MKGFLISCLSTSHTPLHFFYFSIS